MKTLSQDCVEHCSSPPEIELMLCCARSSISTTVAERIQMLIRVGIDWEFLLKEAGQHGILPLLHKTLDEAAAELVPQRVQHSLRSYYQTNFVQNSHLVQQMLSMLAILKEHFVTTVPFQGPVLAAMAYGDLGLREFDDLNILVHEQDYLRAKVLLAIHGDRSLQRRRFLSFSPNFNQVCDRLHPINIAGQSVLTFQPEDVLLSLCVEGTKNHWRQLRQICDVAELIRAYPNLAWERVLRDAQHSGIEQMLLLGLFLAADWLDAPLPKAIAQRLESDAICRLLATQGWYRLVRRTRSFRNWFGVERWESWMTHFRKAKFLQNTLPSEFKYFLHSR